MKTMMTATLAVACAIACAIAGAMPASAATLMFSYTFASTGNTITGSVGGSLAADGNRFVVNQLNALAVNGAAVSNDYSIISADEGYGGPAYASDPTLSLDGSFQDFLLYRGSNISFVLASGDQVAAAAAAQDPAYAAGFGSARIELGGNDQQNPYVRANYAATLVATSVPEPATWGMMIVGFAAVGGVMRRRGKVRTAVSFGWA